MKHLCTLIAMGATLAQTAPMYAYGADLPPAREAVFFGDSLTDAGTYGLRFTTASGRTWAQLVAEHYGQSAEPNEHMDTYADVYKGIHASPGPGGLNYAEGGARVARPYSQVSDDAEGAPVSVEVQLRHFLAQHGTFAPDQIVMLYIGTNDVAYDYDPNNNPILAATLRADRHPDNATVHAQQVRVEAAADAAVRVVQDMLRSGAQRLVVFELADLGEAPWFRTPASQDFANRLTHAYNQRLSAGLPGDPRILVIRMQAFLKPLLDHPQRYGLKRGAHEDACREPDQDFCDANSLTVPDADRTYVFAASEHLTTRANELLASYVLQQIAAHSWQ
jgi:phospholipase/lecithinase/hemolysin